MQNNSTLAIEEVDEDDYEHLPLITKIEKPRDLPALNYSPRFNDAKNKSKTRNKNCQKQKLDSWIFIVDNDSFDRSKCRKK